MSNLTPQVTQNRPNWAVFTSYGGWTSARKPYKFSGIALAEGIPLKTVSYRAGHAQTSTTANIYSHAIKTAD